jgi:putative tryptophan/tyrosine transport system substrate-binding protein
MRRREFLAGLGSTVAALQFAAGAMPALAQTPNRIYRLGHISNSAPSEVFTRQITLPELARLGFVEGRNLQFDPRVGGPGAMAGLMNELLAARPDAVIAIGPTAIAAAGAETRTVPIVAFGADVIELGLAAGYARPGANVTGVVILANELEVKRLSILHEAVPNRRRVAVLTSAVTAVTAAGEAEMRKAAAGFGVELLPFSVTGPADYPAAFAAMRTAGAQALVISATSEFYRDAERLAALALEARLPTVCEWADMARSGCFIGYGPNRTALRKRIAAQIAQIFGGAAPGDIPIERPTVFEFAVNQKIAKALELSVPSAVLAQADDVID